jgi:hypothetical protein
VIYSQNQQDICDILTRAADWERRSLPRSGYIEQPRALALGQVAVKGALKVAPDFGRGGGTIPEELRMRLGRHFQGDFAFRITQG